MVKTNELYINGRLRHTQCKRGHSLIDPANIYMTSTGYPVCRICRRDGRRQERINLRLNGMVTLSLDEIQIFCDEFGLSDNRFDAELFLDRISQKFAGCLWPLPIGVRGSLPKDFASDFVAGYQSYLKTVFRVAAAVERKFVDNALQTE